MTKIYLLLDQAQNHSEIINFLENNKFEIMESIGQIDDILTQIHHFSPDVILINDKVENCEFVIRQIKSTAKNQNTQIIFLSDDDFRKNCSVEFLNLADAHVALPLNYDILISTINSHTKIKKSLDRLYENNKELH